MATREKLVQSYERQRNQLFTELHETQSSVVFQFRKSDKRAEKLERSLRAARNRLAKSLVETRSQHRKKNRRKKGAAAGGVQARTSSRRDTSAPVRDKNDHVWQRPSDEDPDDPARATLNVVDSYVRYQALFLGGNTYGDDQNDNDNDDGNGNNGNIKNNNGGGNNVNGEKGMFVSSGSKRVVVAPSGADKGRKAKANDTNAGILGDLADSAEKDGGVARTEGLPAGVIENAESTVIPAAFVDSKLPPGKKRLGDLQAHIANNHKVLSGTAGPNDPRYADATSDQGDLASNLADGETDSESILASSSGKASASNISKARALRAQREKNDREARERRRRAREAAARKAVLDSLPAGLRQLRLLMLVAKCIMKWKALVRRRRHQRDLMMRREYLTSLEEKREAKRQERGEKMKRSAAAQFAKANDLPEEEIFKIGGGDGASGTASFNQKTPRPASSGATLGSKARRSRIHGAIDHHESHDAAGAGSSSGGVGKDTKNLGTEVTIVSRIPSGGYGAASSAASPSASGGPEDDSGELPAPKGSVGRISSFPQLQMRPATTPRYPRVDILETMADPDPEALAYHDRMKRQADELERYKHERMYHKAVVTNTLFTSAGDLAPKLIRCSFTPSTIRLKVLRDADIANDDYGHDGGYYENQHSSSNGLGRRHTSGGLKSSFTAGSGVTRGSSAFGYNSNGNNNHSNNGSNARRIYSAKSRSGSRRRKNTPGARPATSLGKYGNTLPPRPPTGKKKERPATSGGGRSVYRQQDIDSRPESPLRFSRTPTPRGRVPQGRVRTLSGHA